MQIIYNSPFYTWWIWHTDSKISNIAYRPVSYDIYELSISDVVGRDTHAYLSISMQWIPYAAALILSSKLVCYEPSHTIIRVPFIIDSSLNASSDNHSLLSHIHVYPLFFHMSYRNYVVLLSGSILPFAPWYLTWSSLVCSIYSIIVHSRGCSTCDFCL